ncbi:MAG: hypothetical protein Ctma_0047 [Catillopecten margaritatus gill symbiont]
MLNMALYSFLPVYKVSYDLLVDLFVFTKEFNKEYKYTVGESIKKETIEMIINIYRANSRKDKVKHIVKARENIEVIWVLLRLLRDLKQVNIKKFAGLNDKCESVSKQLTA